MNSIITSLITCAAIVIPILLGLSRMEKKVDALLLSRRMRRKPVTLGRIRVTRKRKRRQR